jgi:cold-inducible RNA-binding protein
MGNRLFVGNLPLEATEKDVRRFIEAEDRTVQSVTLVMDKENNKPRGFAFVEMASEEEAKAAIAALDGKELNGRKLVVNEKQEKAGGGGGKFGGGGGFRGTPHGKEDRKGGFGMRGQTALPRGSQRGGGRGGGRGS